MGRTTSYSLLDQMRKEHILGEMKVIPVTEYVNYGQNWIHHVKNGQSQDSKTNTVVSPITLYMCP
jgi:hypothetical protein